jgi:EAL domain-containing protein (putative c-di-GMP-specific phosphodiesterase class I)
MFPTSQPIILIVDDHPEIADGIAEALQQHGRTVVVAYDPVAAELALRHYAITHMLSDIHFSERLDFAGVQLLDVVRKERPDARVVVMSGHGAQVVRAASISRGANAVIDKPSSIPELEEALLLPPATGEGGTLIRLPPIDELLDGSLLLPLFQPIVHLASGHLLGFEAVIRAAVPAPLGTPDGLFEYASRMGRIVELNAACVAVSLREAAPLLPRGRIFLNVDAPALGHIDFRALLRENAVDPARVVIELSETFAVADEIQAIAAIRELRACGMSVAFDDAGDAHSHFPLLAQVRPEFIKASNRVGALLGTANGDALVSGLLAFAKELGSTFILEGLETPEATARARALGIEMAQGYWFGKPVPAAAHAAPVQHTALMETA